MEFLRSAVILITKNISSLCTQRPQLLLLLLLCVVWFLFYLCGALLLFYFTTPTVVLLLFLHSSLPAALFTLPAPLVVVVSSCSKTFSIYESTFCFLPPPNPLSVCLSPFACIVSLSFSLFVFPCLLLCVCVRVFAANQLNF